MRIIYQGTGIGLVALAMIGAVLPLLPTTPFLLLATACFMRSSPHWNAWLFRTPLFGRALQDWQDHGCVRPKAKIMAIGSMAFLGVPAILCGKLPLGISILLLTSIGIAISSVLLLPAKPLKQHCRANPKVANQQ